MINIEIPKTDIVFFQRILDLNEKEFSEIINVISQLTLRSNHEMLTHLLKQTSINNGEELTNFIFTLIYSLSMAKLEEQGKEEDIYKAFYKGFLKKGGKEIEESFFISRIDNLYKGAISIHNLFEVSKAKELTTNIVQAIEPTLNMAPVFNKKSNELIANVLWSQLSFEYIENGESKSVLLKFDKETLLLLKESIEKLESQSELISNKFLDTGLEIIE